MFFLHRLGAVDAQTDVTAFALRKRGRHDVCESAPRSFPCSR